MADFPIFEKDNAFIEKITKLILVASNEEEVNINFTRNGFSLGIKDEFIDELKKEFEIEEKLLKKLVSSLISVYTLGVRDKKYFEKNQKENIDKFNLILSLFPMETTEELLLKSLSTGNFLEGAIWNIVTLDGTSESEEGVEKFKFIEITLLYSNPETHADHNENITFKVTKKEFAKLISTLNKLQKKIIENGT